jgi:hypothetical protein
MTGLDRFHQLDRAWLGDVLADGGHTTAAVTELHVEPVAFAGATTDMARLRVAYGDTGEPGPTTMIAKLRGVTPLQSQMDQAMGLFGREGRFYTELANQVPVRTPVCYHVGDGDRTPLLLEDLGRCRMGDQMDGMTVPDAQAVLEELADLHAAFWESDRLTEPWLASPGEGVFAGMIVQLVASGAPMLVARYGDEAPSAVLSAILDKAPNWGDVLAKCAEGPPTLVHNDARLDNLFFAQDGTPVLIDWQLLARSRGTQDVGYLLAGSMDTEQLAGNWERLLRRYHDRLQAHGVTGYSFDECVEHYRQSVTYTLGAGMALIGDMDIGDNRGLGDCILVRCLRHIDELDSFATL